MVVLRRAIPVALVVAAALADVSSAPQFAFYALVVAVPFSAAAALAAYGDLVDAAERDVERTNERLQAVCAGTALTLLVIGTAARAPLVGEGLVPPLGTSTLLLCLAALLIQAVAAGAAQIKAPSRVAHLSSEL
jgi:hypothetical protein